MAGSLDLQDLRLVDGHCHSLVRGELDRGAVEALLTEGERPAPGLTAFDSRLGLSVRRWCAPVLGLPPLCPAEEYLSRRAELGAAQVNARLLGACGAGQLLVDTGFRAGELLDLAELAALAQAPVAPVTRLEVLVETAAAGADAAGFAARVAEAVAEAMSAAAPGTVGWKSIAAYRAGLDLPPRAPDAGAVRRAADRWLRRGGRLQDPVLIAHAVHTAARTGLPIQFHTGLGDPEEDLHRANPVLLTAFARAVSCPVVLLHCWPYHREASWLAHVLPNVYFDLGLATGYVGSRAAAVFAEALELAPFGKLLYSSDAFGLPELYLLGALRFRRACARVLGGLVADGEATPADARRIAGMIGAGNARRLYRLGDAG